MKDYLGNELCVGDRIVYVTRTGSSMRLTEARVLDILGTGKIRVQPEARSWSQDTPRKPVTLGEPRYIVRVGS